MYFGLCVKQAIMQFTSNFKCNLKAKSAIQQLYNCIRESRLFFFAIVHLAIFRHLANIESIHGSLTNVVSSK